MSKNDSARALSSFAPSSVAKQGVASVDSNIDAASGRALNSSFMAILCAFKVFFQRMYRNNAIVAPLLKCWSIIAISYAYDCPSIDCLWGNKGGRCSR